MNRRATAVCCLVGIVALALGASPFGDAAQRLVLPANSVGTTQLKNNAVTSSKVRDGSLTAQDFRRGQLPAGPTGPQGPAGPAGPAGTNAALGLQFVSGESGFDSASPKSASVSCPSGKRAISWSFSIQLVTSANESASPGLTEITPNDFDIATGRLPVGYTAKAEEFGFYPDAWKLFVYATCAVVS